MKREFFNYKKGELSSGAIVGIILVIGTLVVAVLFLTGLSEVKSERDICRLSILERASAPIGKGIIPLKCTTEKICITADSKDKCKQFAGEENVRVVKLDIPTGTSLTDVSDRKKAIEKIEEETANAMFDCWKMTGEGKLDIFGGDDLAEITKDIAEISFKELKRKCVVCSRISIGDSVYSKDREINNNYNNDNENLKFLEKIDVNHYMATENVPGTKTSYLNTFAGGDVVKSYAEFSLEDSKSEGKFTTTSQIAMVFMQIKIPVKKEADEVFKDTFLGSAIMGGISAFGVNQITPKKIVGRYLILAEAALIGVVSLNIASQAAEIQKNNLLSASYCGKFKTNQENRFGCSLTRGMVWNGKNIDELCEGGIESNF